MTAMPRFKDTAICIRHVDWSETSQVVALLTREHGKVAGVAKGAKRMSPSAVARYSGGIELLTAGEIVGIIKASAELATLTEWNLLDPHPHLRRDYEAMNLALYASDLCGAMLADHDPHPAVFDAMRTLLQGLADVAGRHALLLRFQWTLLGEAGYAPDLDLARQRDLDRVTLVFDCDKGKLHEDESLARDDSPNGPWRVRGQTVAALLAMEDGEVASGEDCARGNRLLGAYVRTVLGRELPTMHVAGIVHL